MMQEIVEKYAPDVVKHPFEYSFLELWEAIAKGKPPAEPALEALAVVFGALESSAGLFMYRIFSASTSMHMKIPCLQK